MTAQEATAAVIDAMDALGVSYMLVGSPRAATMRSHARRSTPTLSCSWTPGRSRRCSVAWAMRSNSIARCRSRP